MKSIVSSTLTVFSLTLALSTMSYSMEKDLLKTEEQVKVTPDQIKDKNELVNIYFKVSGELTTPWKYEKSLWPEAKTEEDLVLIALQQSTYAKYNTMVQNGIREVEDLGKELLGDLKGTEASNIFETNPKLFGKHFQMILRHVGEQVDLGLTHFISVQDIKILSRENRQATLNKENTFHDFKITLNNLKLKTL